MLISWNDTFALGIDAIDNGHGLAIEAINQLNEVSATADCRRVSAFMLPLLRHQFALQFEVEARLLAALPADRRAQHEGEHRRLLDVLDILGQAQAGGEDISAMLLLNLVCFVVSHLRGSDSDAYGVRRAAPRAA